MPRGRHRHSQPLHRLLPPVAVAAVALACAGGSWLVGEPGIGDPATVTLRGLAAAAAVAAVVGSVQSRRWDRVAGKRVGELRARMASAEWRAEERQAELEGELEEAREARTRAEAKLRARRGELARLRSEHADLLRRYAHAEADLASALEGQRKLELEAKEPAKALTAGATDYRDAAGAPTALTYLQAHEALRHLVRNAGRQREQAERSRPVDTSKPASPFVPAPGARGAHPGPAVPSDRPANAPSRAGGSAGGASGGGASGGGAGQGGSAQAPAEPAADAEEEKPAETFDFFGKGAPAAKSASAPSAASAASANASARRERRRPAAPASRAELAARRTPEAGGEESESGGEDSEEGSGGAELDITELRSAM
ncbi:hypothetical protein [Streptomyces sp. ODS28]|uniref:hypothetical protein n=1 Tax=Streptomyces sp. ODS28 TaxID=3136688 RepID=UPI0031EBAB1F